MATASNAAAAANPEAQRFWDAVADWPEQAQRAFWEGSARLSEFIGENPNPRVLQFDRGKPPPDMPWWEKALFYYGQSHVNRAVVAQAQAQATVQGATWLWGALQGDFNKSPTTGQIVTGGVLSMIPVVDQLCDVRDVVANCLALSDEEGRRDEGNWFALGLTCFGFIPTVGSAVKTVAKVAVHKGVRLIDIVKRMEWLESLGGKVRLPWGRAPLSWLQRYDWAAAAKTAGAAAKRAFENALRKIETAVRWATGAVKARLQQLAETFKAIIARVESAIEKAALKVRESIQSLLRRDKRVIGRFDAMPGVVPNPHVQKQAEPPPDRRLKSGGSRVATAPGTAFFWSGYSIKAGEKIGGEDIAAGIAKGRQGITLETLLAERGIAMPKFNRNDPASVKVWHEISEEYAMGVSGEVRAVVGKNVRPDAVWLTRELPALKGNPAVTRITTIDPATLEELVIFSR